jgi:hypothetical protein
MPARQPASKRPAAGRIALTEKKLLELAGEVYFERGTDYHDHGTVVHLEAGDNGITARVQGSTHPPTCCGSGARAMPCAGVAPARSAPAALSANTWWPRALP